MTIYKQRIHHLQKALQELSCDALLVEDSINLYYLTGLQLSSGRLIVHRKESHLLVDGRYFEFAQKISPVTVLLSDKDHNAFQELFETKYSSLNMLGFNTESTSYKNFLDLQSTVNVFNNQHHRQISLVPVDNPVKYLRSIKDNSEAILLREAAKLGSEGFDYACTQLYEGVTEIEVAAELEIFWKRRGAKGPGFEPIIAFGANASMPHYRAGTAKLKKGDCVLIDIGVTLNQYNSDMTRVVFFGNPDAKILEVYSIVVKSQQAALDLCRPGTLIGELDQAARHVITEHGYGEYFTHSLGHGIGLEVHESPILRNAPPYQNTPLKEGMAITIEPGIYLPGIGGVRIEDTVLITSKGHENLTNRNKEPRVIGER